MRHHIPNLLTAANLLCGVIALLFAISGDLIIAALFMGLGMVFDFFDGMVARWLNVQGPLGVQLDSMADLISFGLAPSLILLQLMQMSFYGEIKPLTEVFTARAWQLGIDTYYPFLALIVVVASAFRLARFNIDERQVDHFIGLPTPANALLIASLPLIFEYHYTQELAQIVFNKWFLMGLTVTSAYALNAPWPLFSLKFKSLAWRDNKHRYLLIGLSICLIIGLGYRAIPFVLLSYILMSLVWKKQWMK